jgi:potassium efflux system protein
MRLLVTRMLSLLIWLLCLSFSTALAQTEDSARILKWNDNIEQAKHLLEQKDTTIKELELVRQLLASQREEAQAIFENGSIPLRTLQAQLDALGPAPVERATESEQIQERRIELQKQISEANEPLIKAEEIVKQSKVLIEELDSNIRQKSTSALFVRGSSPLIVTNWKAAAVELADALRLEKEALQGVFENPYAKHVLKNRLPLSLFLFLLGLITITFVRGLVMRRLTKLYSSAKDDSLTNWPAIAVNLAHLALPSLSVGFFLAGFYLLQIDIYGLRKSISYLPLVVIFLAIGHWLGNSLFAPSLKQLRIIQVDDRRAFEGYRILLLLGLALSLMTAQGLIESGYRFTETSKAVLTLPIILMGGLLLWRLSAIIMQARQNIVATTESIDTESAIEAALLLLLTQLLRAAAIFSTLIILLGFTNLAREILGPMLASVAILGLCFFIFQALIDILEPLLGRSSAIKDSSPTLLPIVVIFFIGLVALPLMALNWGIRWATLVDIWLTLKEGITIGETRISLDIIFLLAAIFAIGVGITRWLQKLFRVAILPRTRLDIGGQNALITGIGYTGITLSALIAISSAGLDLSSLAIFAGALSVGIGFGLQTIASNFVSGIILLIERPIKEGDWIDVAGYSGYVRKISVRSTRIETFDRHDVIIPNAELVAGVVTNMTLTGMTGRVIVPVGVAYGTDAEEVKRLLLEIAANHQMVLNYPKPSVLFMGLGESSIDFELRCFVKDVNLMLGVRSDINFAIYKELGEAGIEIPFPQRVVTMKQDNG